MGNGKNVEIDKERLAYADDIAFMSTSNLVDRTLDDLRPLNEQLDL